MTIRVKVSIKGAGIAPSLSQFFSRSDTTEGIDFQLNDPACRDADVWLIVEQPDENDRHCRVAPQKVLYLGAETSFSPGYWNRFRNRRSYLRQFGEVHSWLPIKHRGLKRSLPFLPWMINANHGSSILAPHYRDADWIKRNQPEKRRLLSVFCSDKTFTAGHRQRLRFVERLSQEFGSDLDWYGNGIRSMPEKWDGLAPYSFAVVLENQSLPDLITEKLYDAFLGSAFPIYWGAPNVYDYFPPRSMATIDIGSPESAIRAIRGLIQSNRDQKDAESVLRARDLVLSNYNFAKRLAILAQEIHLKSSEPKEEVHLAPLGPDPGYLHLLTRGRAALMGFRGR